MIRRTYGEACAAAHALDLVGERWALLVVRELLLGPKRFTDLRGGLPHASASRLSQRLDELEQVGIVQRRKLGPPAGSWVYELTGWGYELEEVLTELARWGRRSPHRPRDAEASIDAVMLLLRSHFDPDASDGLSATYQLHLDEDTFSVRVADRQLTVARGEAPEPVATIRTDPKTLAALLTNRPQRADVTSGGRLTLVGDAPAFARLLDAFTTS